MLFSKRLERIADGLSIYWRDRKPLPTKASVVTGGTSMALWSHAVKPSSGLQYSALVAAG